MPAPLTEPLIIEVALNGLSTRERNPNTPIESEELAADAIACIRAGASIVHQHDKAFLAGGTSLDMAEQATVTYGLIYGEIPDALCYPTTGGRTGSIEERWAHNLILNDRGLLTMAFVDPGSVNYVQLADDGLPAPVDGRYSFSNIEIRYMFEQSHRLRLSPNIMILDAGFLRMVTAIARAGALPAGSFVKLGLGGSAGQMERGLPPTIAAFECLLSMMEGVPLTWAVAVMSGDCIGSGLAEQAIRRGGHVRIGLEDYAGDRQPTNVELVREAAELATRLGRPVATPAQAARLLGVRSR
jgi:3-keto-5-aminohexanoate cleavage enzyme